MPTEALELLQRRECRTEFVLPSVAGKLRDVNNTEADWRSNLARLGYPTFTSHGLRKTCATALDVAGISARGIAEYLGHKRPSMTIWNEVAVAAVSARCINAGFAWRREEGPR